MAERDAVLQRVSDEVAENAYRRARESLNPRRPREINESVVEEIERYLDKVAPTVKRVRK